MTDLADTHFKNQVRVHLIDRGLTMKQLADEMGMFKGNLSQVLSHRSFPTFKTITRMVVAINAISKRAGQPPLRHDDVKALLFAAYQDAVKRYWTVRDE